MLPKISNYIRLLLVGPSSSGKSTFVEKFILHIDELMHESVKPKKILYFGKFKNAISEAIRTKVEFFNRLPNSEDFENPGNESILIILDDFQNEIFTDKNIISAFQGSRHNKISIILLTQQLFPKNNRDISLNANLIVLMHNNRDSSGPMYLSRQLDCLHPKVMSNIFYQNVTKPFQYLFINLMPECHSALRYQGEIFAPTREVYMSRDQFNQLNNEENREIFELISTI